MGDWTSILPAIPMFLIIVGLIWGFAKLMDRSGR